MSRPEHSNAPEDFYDESEAAKYAVSSRMLAVQREITARALELLNLPSGEPQLLLDVGCGSGLSGDVLARHGHTWVGVDVSAAMLGEAKKAMRRATSSEEDDDDEDDDDEDDDDDDDMEEDDMDEEQPPQHDRPTPRGSGDLLLNDMGNGLNFRPNTFDGCVSISAVQWLCYSHRADHVPHKRLRAFFSSLYACLRRGARAAIQLYPENPEQMEMITNAAMAAGFTGGVVVDYPNSTKAKKFYLVLFAGSADKHKKQPELPQARGEAAAAAGRKHEVDYERARNPHHQHNNKRMRRDEAARPAKGSREWIAKKKEVQRRQGKDVRPDSKFSGRRRSGKLW